ncbi:MAG: tetratricopeptide repeat protein [Alphaproteobacteria bacterium]|nr:tetratricopeptide repeat protein [Alphaproteobacteria bacterium]
MNAVNTVNHDSLLGKALESLRGRGNPDGAMLRLVIFSPGFVGGYLAWGDRLARDGKGMRGMSLLRKALILGPGDSRAHLSLSNAAFRRREVRTARIFARGALLLNPVSTQGYRDLASAAIAMGDHATAVQVFLRSRCIVPLGGRDLLALTWAFFELDRLAECLLTLKGYVLENPNDPAGNTLLTRVFGRRERLEDAALQGRRLLAMKPGDPDVLLAMARIGLSRRRFTESVARFQGALVLRPGDGPSIFDLARAYWGGEAFSEAERVMKRACRINPRYQNRAEVLRLSATPRDFRVEIQRETLKK